MGYSRKWKKNVAKLSHDTINHQPIYALCSLPKLKAQCCNNHDSEEGSVSGNSQYSATNRESTHSGTLSHISSFGDSLVQDQDHRCSTPYVSYFGVRWTVLCGKRDNYLTLPPERDVVIHKFFSTTAHKITNCLLTHFMISCGNIQYFLFQAYTKSLKLFLVFSLLQSGSNLRDIQQQPSLSNQSTSLPLLISVIPFYHTRFHLFI